MCSSGTRDEWDTFIAEVKEGKWDGTVAVDLAPRGVGDFATI